MQHILKQPRYVRLPDLEMFCIKLCGRLKKSLEIPGLHDWRLPQMFLVAHSSLYLLTLYLSS